MALSDEQARAQTLANMAKTRAEIKRLLEPPPPHDEAGSSGGVSPAGNGQFPRSRTMRLLLSGRGMGAVGAVIGGVLLARPALALRLLRMVPLASVAKALTVRALSTRRERKPR